MVVATSYDMALLTRPTRHRCVACYVALLSVLLLQVVAVGYALAQQSAPAERLDDLSYIQQVLDEKLQERSAIGERIESANEQDQADLRREAETISVTIEQLRSTLERMATNDADTSLFVDAPVEQQRDWKEDLTLIAQPVIDSLKELTEKPRRIKALNDEISLQQSKQAAAEAALAPLQAILAENPDGSLAKSLDSLRNTWQRRADDAANAVRIAELEIASLQGDQSLLQSIAAALEGFARGRGLTLLIAVAAALGVWLGVRTLLRGYQHALLDRQRQHSRTRYRLAAYSVHAATVVLILIAVFVVFYERGDVLLLGLLIMLIMGFALSVRQLLPRYILEARLLLNIGAMREGERVIFRDLPWRVESINMYTVFRNPALSGELRIPLSELRSTVSRPVASDDPWFPTSRGDFVISDDGRLLEVLQQTPDTVELRTRGGQIICLPSASFYAMTMDNLSRGGCFGVECLFGIDYDLQAISTTDVPERLRVALQAAIAASELADALIDLRVELYQAGSSSIDYWAFARFDSQVARSYRRIERMMQAVCIDTCTREGWSIPFPHVSVVPKASAELSPSR